MDGFGKIEEMINMFVSVIRIPKRRSNNRHGIMGYSKLLGNSKISYSYIIDQYNNKEMMAVRNELIVIYG